MLVEEEWCNRLLHFRGLDHKKHQTTFPDNRKNLTEKQQQAIFDALQSYRTKKNVTTKSLVEWLLSICVDMTADDSYHGNAGAILPFAQALTLIMNHAHSAEWFDGGDEWT